MAVKGSRISVTTGATLVSTAAGATGEAMAGARVLVRNRHATVSVSLGGSTVTAAAGFELLAGEFVAIDLDAGEKLYAAAASGTVTVHVLEGGV